MVSKAHNDAFDALILAAARTKDSWECVTKAIKVMKRGFVKLERKRIKNQERLYGKR